MILSTAFEMNGEYRGRSRAELEGIGASIRAGNPYSFDPEDIRALILYASEIARIPASRLAMDALKWLGPPLLLLAVLYYFILRH